MTGWELYLWTEAFDDKILVAEGINAKEDLPGVVREELKDGSLDLWDSVLLIVGNCSFHGGSVIGLLEDARGWT